MQDTVSIFCPPISLDKMPPTLMLPPHQVAFIRTQILRRIIDWGENAIGPPGVGASYGDAAAAAMEGVAPGSGAEVTVMIWQDQGMSQVTHLPRGTTVGQVSVEGVGGEGRVGAGDSALQAVEQGVGRRPSASGTCDAAIMVLTVPVSWRVQPAPLMEEGPVCPPHARSSAPPCVVWLPMGPSTLPSCLCPGVPGARVPVLPPRDAASGVGGPDGERQQPAGAGGDAAERRRPGHSGAGEVEDLRTLPNAPLLSGPLSLHVGTGAVT